MLAKVSIESWWLRRPFENTLLILKVSFCHRKKIPYRTKTTVINVHILLVIVCVDISLTILKKTIMNSTRGVMVVVFKHVCYGVIHLTYSLTFETVNVEVIEILLCFKNIVYMLLFFCLSCHLTS